MSDDTQNFPGVPVKIMRRIQALLARANHPNTPEPEAKLAQEQVERLMIRYSITEVSEDDIRANNLKIGFWDISINGTHRNDKASLLIAVADVFSCRVLRRGNNNSNYSWELFGKEGDLAMVFTLFDHLLRQMERRLNIEGAGQSQAFKKSFISYFALSVSKRLEDLYKQEIEASGSGTELVLANVKDAVDNYINDLYPDLGKMKARKSELDFNGALSGMEAGKEADIFLPGARFDAETRHSAIEA